MSELLAKFEQITSNKPADGRSLFGAASGLNSFWFRNRLPECDAHDTMNLIDSEGEERFKAGLENAFGSEKQFFDNYIQLYNEAVPKLREILEKIVAKRSL